VIQIAFLLYLLERGSNIVSSNEEVGLRKSCFYPSKIFNLIIRVVVVVVVVVVAVVVVEMLLMQISSSSKKSSFEGVVENLTNKRNSFSAWRKKK
jgi:hypothetical protein